MELGSAQQLFTDAAIRLETRCQKPDGGPGVCTGRGLLACYYPFTQIARLISFQMGRINWFRLEHQAYLIEMNPFPLPNGHFLSCCWLGRGAAAFPSRPSRCGAAELGEPAVTAMPCSPRSIWEGAPVSPSLHPTQILSKPSGSCWDGECESQVGSAPCSVPGSLAGHLGGTQVALLPCCYGC